MLWCAVCLMAGIAVGLHFPLPYYLPVLVAAVIACTLLRKTRHWHDILTLLVWFLIGCSRAGMDCRQQTTNNKSWTSDNGFQSVRTALIARLKKSGVSQKTLALCSALVVGEKSGLDYETKESYRKVGAAHLLALSGTHIGIIYGFLYLIFIGWVHHSKWRWHALPLILLCLWGYALVAGMPVSLVRATLMLSIFTILSLMQYETDHMHVLALSAVIILLIAPEDLFSISFQLSFAAVFFLLALWGPIRDMYEGIPSIVKLLATSCVAFLGIMPLIAYYFHRVSLVGPFLSVILIPLTTIIIYLTLAAMLFPVAPLGWLLNVVVALQERILEFAGSIPFAITDIYPNLAVIVLMYGAMVIAIVRLRTR